MNKHIIASVMIIGASGVVNAWTNHKPITIVILGTYVFLLVLSIADMFGGQVSQLAGGMALLAALTVLLTEFPWNTVLGAVQGKKA
jgi:uncharacterized membrane protein